MTNTFDGRQENAHSSLVCVTHCFRSEITQKQCSDRGALSSLKVAPMSWFSADSHIIIKILPQHCRHKKHAM